MEKQPSDPGQAFDELERALSDARKLARLIRAITCPCYVPDIGTRQAIWKNKN